MSKIHATEIDIFQQRSECIYIRLASFQDQFIDFQKFYLAFGCQKGNVARENLFTRPLISHGEIAVPIRAPALTDDCETNLNKSRGYGKIGRPARTRSRASAQEFFSAYLLERRARLILDQVRLIKIAGEAPLNHLTAFNEKCPQLELPRSSRYEYAGLFPETNR